MNVSDRINRILFIMSYVSQHQGVPLQELAQAAGLRTRQLEKELDFMLLIGKPPFRPDDYVDIYVDEELKVWIDFDQSLNRPLRFTRPEAMALLLSLQLLDAEVDPRTVASLRGKIQTAIEASVDPKARLEDRIVLDHPSQPVSEHFRRLRESTDAKRKIRIKYWALTRDSISERVVRPFLLLKHLGYWYLTGYCETRLDIRTFKFERILSVEELQEGFEIAPDFDAQKYQEEFLTSMGRQQVEIRFDKQVAPWIQERWGADARPDGDGVVLTLFSETMEYPARLVLEHAPHARPLSPPALLEKVRRDAEEVLQAYRSNREEPVDAAS